MSKRPVPPRTLEARPDVSEENPLPTEHHPEPQPTSHLIDEIKETADKLARDRATRGDIKIIARALKELREPAERLRELGRA